MVNIEELVSEAKKYLERKNGNTFWCSTSEVIALLEAGATQRSINQRLNEGRTYLQEVSYKGITFISATEELVQELEKYTKKK